MDSESLKIAKNVSLGDKHEIVPVSRKTRLIDEENDILMREKVLDVNSDVTSLLIVPDTVSRTGDLCVLSSQPGDEEGTAGDAGNSAGVPLEFKS